MSKFYSPLRYPGGKNKLTAFLAKICVDNKINGHYIEPYSGGASIALFLLLEQFVDRITINDKDRSIYAFWHSVLNNTDKLCSLIDKTEITIKQWRIQRTVQADKAKADLLKLGFSTFFLNRTNRSGIITGGPIGGIDQTGDYLLDCRFNKDELIDRIRKIAACKSRIHLYKKDATNLIDYLQKDIEITNSIFYFDPPYYLKADSLYMNHYKSSDHEAVSKKIRAIKGIRWVVSYDNVPEIRNLYKACPNKEYSFTHTAYQAKIGNEVLFFSKNISLPMLESYNPVQFKYNKKKKIILYVTNPRRRAKQSSLVL
jgi:DNA adenine methylase